MAERDRGDDEGRAIDRRGEREPVERRTDDDRTVAEGPGARAVDRERVVERERPVAPGAARGASPRERAAEVRERQRAQFGGFHFGPAFFGWLVAVGLGVLLTALLSAAGAAVGLTNPVSDAEAVRNAQEIGIASVVALLVVLFIAYFAGGYVAGRLARFNGAKHGFGVWAIALVVAVLLAVLGAVAGAEYNVLSGLKQPSIPVSGETLAGGGAIALIVVLAVTLLGAVLGGSLGVRFHEKVDRAGFAV